jgi:streptomycin 6-kinase
LIDPKPLVGDPAFDAGYLVADLAAPSPKRRDVDRIVSSLAAGLGVESGRVRAWALIRAVENIFWYQDLGQEPAVEMALAEALHAGR